ncbi:hypothetical protein J6590_022271 [Homalodisca vitripennis]|nr:hypothetical protein J6590_022271 [Homalodisca vitripennis]
MADSQQGHRTPSCSGLHLTRLCRLSLHDSAALPLLTLSFPCPLPDSPFLSVSYNNSSAAPCSLGYPTNIK